MQDYPSKRVGWFVVGVFAFGVLFTVLTFFMAAYSTGAYGGRSEEPEAVQGADGNVDMAAAEEIFETRCTTCHGPRGAGDGPASAGLSPRPRDFTDPEWQASVDNEHLERIIVGGGAAVGLSPAMPNNPDLRDREEVVAGLRRLIRTFAAH